MKLVNSVLIFCLFLIGCNSSTESSDEQLDVNTAGFMYNKAESYAKSLDGSLRLKSISSSDVNYDGTAEEWSFKYSTSPTSDYTVCNYYFSSFGGLITCESIVTEKATTGDAFISKSWMNSSEAMKIAEENGGEQFRRNNSRYYITASLGEAVVADPSPCWHIKYTVGGSSSYIVFNIDAVTGSVQKYSSN